jgi:hypothetical protein
METPVTTNSTLTAGQPVPANVAQAAADAGLGALLRVFTPKRRNWVAVVLAFVIGLVTIICLVGFFILWALFRTPNLSRSMAARRLYLYEHGFVLVERADNPQVYRWDDVQTVFQKIVSNRSYGVETSRTYLYTVTARDGRTVKVTQFWNDIAQLGSHINHSVSLALLPATLTAIQRGQSVQFGDMMVNATGIAGRRKSVTWPEVRNVRITKGFVSVDVAGRFFSLSTTAAAKIPNLPLFLTLTERLRPGAR